MHLYSEVKHLKYYIASPGFNREQLEKIQQLETNFSERGIEYYSPFTHGGTLGLTGDWMDKLRVKNIFDENIVAINNCNRMVAVVEDIDKGTLFEIGYFASQIAGYVDDEYDHVDTISVITHLNQSLILLGKYSDTISSILVSLIDSDDYRGWIDLDFKNSLDREFVEKETLNAYIKLGYAFGMNHPVFTKSTNTLDSNLMTACSTLHHFLSSEIEDYDLEDLLPGTLQPMRFSRKME